MCQCEKYVEKKNTVFCYIQFGPETILLLYKMLSLPNYSLFLGI